jgi:hypothetical protein
MSLNRVEHLIYRDGLDLLRFLGYFNKHVRVQVIVVVCNIFLDVTQQEKDVHTLL